jgi:lipopolysaccharide/colanic/teichoic acid biosynthesis glycosyltransferase
LESYAMEKGFSRVSLITRYRSWYGAPVKRVLDVAISLVALALLAPFFGLIALAIKRDSPGPVIYRGPRMGRGGRTFRILKFRTMYETPVSYSGPKVTAHDDPRVTPLGRWLRDMKLNELPQLWNVLKGDMSLVGPRPEDPDIVQSWPAAARDKILSVRPGITSPASVLYRNEEALLCAEDLFRQYIQELTPDKMRLDQLYVRHLSFCLDLDTLLWTALIILPRFRSHESPEQHLFVGPITHLVRRYVNWFVADLIVTLVAVGSTGLLWRIYGPLNVGWPRCIAAALALALLFSATGAALGVNRIAWSKAVPKDVYDLMVAWAMAAILACGANLLVGVLPVGLVIMASLLAFFGFVAVRYQGRLAAALLSYILRYRATARRNRERVLIVGSDHNAQNAAWILDQPENARKFQVLGFVDNDWFAQGMRVHGKNVVGTCGDIPGLVAKHDIGVIVLADRSITQDQYRSIEELCRTAKIGFAVMPNVVDSLGNLCRGSSLRCEIEDAARDSVDIRCLQCLLRRGAEQMTPLLQESFGAEVQ